MRTICALVSMASAPVLNLTRLRVLSCPSVSSSAIIRAVSSAGINFELVGGEGWSPDDYELWLTDVLRELLPAKPRLRQISQE